MLYPLKESLHSEDLRKGNFLHASHLIEDQVDALLDAAKEYQEKTENP
ncbi:unnamed protein product [marine sediment metagenome]|uniref:Uncharacterized protein n=1 Tax=marine sediment metagenome TaxID=412755 RepID=X0U987_9ZZZZ